MKLFVTETELDTGDLCLKSMHGKPGVTAMLKHDYNIAKGILKTLCVMEGKEVPNSTALIDLIDNLCVKILGTGIYYIYATHPTIENVIYTKHTGANLHGHMMEADSAIMQVFRQSNGVCWYITDQPFESNILTPFTIYNKGNGYFEYFGKDAPIGSEYYIPEFKEWSDGRS